MLLKYFVNKHNLYFVYRPNPIDIQIHMEAIDMVMPAATSCLLWLYFNFVLTAGEKQMWASPKIMKPQHIH